MNYFIRKGAPRSPQAHRAYDEMWSLCGFRLDNERWSRERQDEPPADLCWFCQEAQRRGYSRPLTNSERVAISAGVAKAESNRRYNEERERERLQAWNEGRPMKGGMR